MEKSRSISLMISTAAIALLMISTTTAVGQVQSGPIISVLAKRESLRNELNQFMRLDKHLTTVDKEKLNKILKVLDKKGIVHRLQNFNISNVFNDNRFIGLMNSAQMQSLLTSQTAKKIYNTPCFQNITHNQTFMTFVNSEACQYFLAHLIYTRNSSKDKSTLIQSITEPIGQVQSSNITWLPGEIILLIIIGIIYAIAYLLFGFITWPFAAGFSLLFAFVAFPYFWEDATDALLQYTSFTLLAIIYGFFITILAGIFILLPCILLWPIIWGLILYQMGKAPPFP
jgi:hypothetical protein